MITVREWREEDIARIAALETECFSDPWTASDLEACLRFPVYRHVLLEENGELIGYACETLLFDEGEIANVAVSPKFRGRGFGRRLMDLLEERAKNEGVEKLFLEVRVSNAPALALYKGRGFAPLSTRKKYYADGEDALVMTKRIKK